MPQKHSAKTIIQTGAHSILYEAASLALETARLAIARGPAGIGKSFALTLLQDSLSNDRDTVLKFTATARNGKSWRRFFEEAALEFGLNGYGGQDPMERLERALMQSYPFRRGGSRILLIIDECQHLDAKLIECLRALYDKGEFAHDFDSSQAAFGLLLVGNPHFLSKAGKAERAAFEALLSRCPIEVTLDRPEGSEYADLALSFFAAGDERGDALAEHGKRFGNLRVMATSYDLARHFAGSGQMTMVHLKKAFLFSAEGK